jgi:hypothetical protein
MSFQAARVRDRNRVARRAAFINQGRTIFRYPNPSLK